MKQTTFFGGSSDASTKRGVEEADRHHDQHSAGHREPELSRKGEESLRHTSGRGLRSASGQRSGESSRRRTGAATAEAVVDDIGKQEQHQMTRGQEPTSASKVSKPAHGLAGFRESQQKLMDQRD